MELKDKLYDLKANALSYFDVKYKSNPDKFQILRNNAIEIFTDLGIPNIKVEDWKYTNVAFLNRIDFDFNKKTTLEKIDFSSHNIDNTNLVVIINGKISEEYSNFNFQNGIEISSINDIDSNFENYIGKITNLEHHFTALNTAIFDGGIFINVKDNIDAEFPIQLLFVNSANANEIHNYRKLIKIGNNSNVKFIESYLTIGENAVLNNNVGEIFVGKNSNIEINFVQNNSTNDNTISSNYIYQERDSVFTSLTFGLNGKFTRNYLSTILDDENCTTNYYGIFIPNGNEVMDNHTLVNHAKPHCYSNENYRGVIADKAIGVFNGKIYVAKDAQKTNAYQSNKNILLSDSATINTKPELEIYADDVKCSHGATSGSLDAESLFYLRARGIDFNTAQSLLLNAFVGEITEKITINKLKEKVESIIEKKLSNK